MQERGGAPIDLSPGGDFGQIQSPQLSLDGRHVTYNDETKVMVRSLDPDDTRAS